MSNELLPCPFCFHAAKFYSLKGGTCGVECVTCSATMGPFYTKAEALAAWNRRAAQGGGTPETGGEG